VDDHTFVLIEAPSDLGEQRLHIVERWGVHVVEGEPDRAIGRGVQQPVDVVG
jgi:hypothetical protein